jgi:hypothetical protein
MKRLGFFMMVLLVSLVSCSKHEVREEQRDVQAKLERTIADIDHALDSLKRESVTAADTTKEQVGRQVDELERARKDLQTDLDRLGEITTGAWNDFRRSVDRSLENGRRAIKDVKRDFSR